MADQVLSTQNMEEGSSFSSLPTPMAAGRSSSSSKMDANPKAQRVNSLRIVTILMMLFSLMTYLQGFANLNVNVEYSVSSRTLAADTDETSHANPSSKAQSGDDDDDDEDDDDDDNRLEKSSGREERFVPLPELVRADEKVTCPEGLYAVQQVVNMTADLGLGRKIPRIIHQTGEGKCLTKPFYDNAVNWSFEGYSYYFHDKAARDRLFEKYWPEFPQLQNSFECLKNAGGAAVADLWRYLAIWEYGGVYVDMDDAPNTLFNSTTLTEDTDAFFLVERVGLLSQYFFALSPKHPVMYLAVHDAMEQMHLLDDTGTFYVPRTTGPSCVKRAFLKFMGTKEGDTKNPDYWKYQKPPAGFYTGLGNRTVTVMANTTTQDNWVMRNALKKVKKREGWENMNFTNYQFMNKIPSNKTCLQLILEKHQSESELMQELRRKYL